MREDLINRVLELQERCNRSITLFGFANPADADELDELANKLTIEEGGEVLRRSGW